MDKPMSSHLLYFSVSTMGATQEAIKGCWKDRKEGEWLTTQEQHTAGHVAIPLHHTTEKGGRLSVSQPPT